MISFMLAGAMVVPAAGASQLDRRGLIEQALDEPARITLENVRLGDAVEKLAEQTGVRIFMPPEVMDFAPYGADTVVQRIEIQNISLRQGLTELLAPLGMTFYVARDHIAVEPVDALRCLGRAPTWNELDLLAELSAMQPGVNEQDRERLRGRVQFRVPVADGWAALAAAMGSVGAGPGDEVLSLACAKLGWGWCLADRQIIVSSGAHQIRRRLEQPISLRMNYRPLIEVLQEVGRAAGIRIHPEPGALQSLPLQVQKSFSLLVADTPAEQVLEKLAAETGLGYLIEPDGVLFFKVDETSLSAEGDARAAAATGAGDPYVAKIVMPLGDGRSVEWLIRRSELPSDLRRMRAEDLQDAFEAIRQQAKERP